MSFSKARYSQDRTDRAEPQHWSHMIGKRGIFTNPIRRANKRRKQTIRMMLQMGITMRDRDWVEKFKTLYEEAPG